MGDSVSKNHNIQTHKKQLKTKHRMTLKKYIIDPIVNMNNSVGEKYPAYKNGLEKGNDYVAEKTSKLNNWVASDKVQAWNHWAHQQYQTSRAQGACFAVDASEVRK